VLNDLGGDCAQPARGRAIEAGEGGLKLIRGEWLKVVQWHRWCGIGPSSLPVKQIAHRGRKGSRGNGWGGMGGRVRILVELAGLVFQQIR
jgi:hypothetical protein